MSRSIACLLALGVATLISLSPSLAGTTGVISGRVTDDKGGPIAGARVTAISPSESKSATTDATGFYSILNLSPDTYAVASSKDGFDTISVTGYTVQADQTTRVDLSMKPSAKVIGHITASANASVVNKAVTGDLYAVNAQAINSYQGSAGGAETLYSQNGVVGSLPGVLRSVGTGGGYAGNGSISMRGGTNDQVGFELEGIPLNRSFDAANATSFVTNGLSSLEVYTGGEPADAGRSMSGYINEQIRRGSYPGGSDLTFVAGAPVYNHTFQADAYGGTPDQRFTWYLSTLAVNADYNFSNRSNLDNATQPVAANDPTCAFFNAQNGTSIDCTKPFNVTDVISHAAFWNFINPSAAIRDTVLNLHYQVRHGDMADDIQALYNVGTTGNPFPYSGGMLDPNLAEFLTPGGAVGWPFGRLYIGPLGQPFNGASVERLTWPSSNQSIGPIPSNFQDHQNTQSGIEKLGYTREFTPSSFLRVYAYSLYSLWAFDQPTNPFVGDSWYQLHDNATGYTMNYQNQVNARHLLRFDVDYVKDLTLRYNYAPDFFGFDSAPDTIGSNVKSTEFGGVQALCGTISLGLAGLKQCGGPGDTVAFIGGPYAYWNQLPAINTDLAIADSWQASDNLLIDLGARLDRFQIVLTPLQITGPNGIAEQAQNQFGTCLDGYNYAPGEPCNGYLNAIATQFAAPNVAPGAAHWQNVSGSLFFNEFSPRFGVTYTLPDRDVLRFSVGRYVEPPNTFGEEYIAAPVWGAGNTVSVLNNFYDGLGFLAVHNIKPQDSTNYDASYERDFGGGWSAKITPFIRNTRGQILSIPVTPNNPTFVTGYNFGTARIRGSEFLLRKVRSGQDGLSATFSATYTDTKLRYERTLGTTNFIDTINTQISAYNAAYSTHFPLFDPNGFYSPSAFQAFGSFSPSYDVRWVANLTLDERTHGFDIIPTFNYQSGSPYGDPLQFPDFGPQGLSFGPDPYTHQFDGLGSLVGPSWLTMNLGISHDIARNMKGSLLVTNVFTTVHNHGYPWEFPAKDQVLAYEDNEFYGFNTFGSFAPHYAGDAYYPYAPASLNPTPEFVFSVSMKM